MQKYIVLAALFMMSCQDPYRAARSTILIGDGVVAMSQTAFDTYVQVETQKCQDKCKADPACLEKCMEPVKKNALLYKKSKLLAQAGLREASALVTVAEKLKKKDPGIDWLVPLKGAACLLAKSLDFIPEVTKKKIQNLIDIVGNFGCPK